MSERNLGLLRRLAATGALAGFVLMTGTACEISFPGAGESEEDGGGEDGGGEGGGDEEGGDEEGGGEDDDEGDDD